jgi:hypothetical protein
VASSHQCPHDRLLDPVTGVGAEAGIPRRVEALDRPQQSQVAFGDEVLQAQALAGVAAGDVDHQAQVGADQVVADRPDRYEPRLKKRRRNYYDWLTKPRAEIKRKMAKGVTNS